MISSCQIPRVDLVERCAVSIAYNKCRCHLYDANEDERRSNSQDLPIEHCNRGIVFPLESWQELQVWFNEIKEYRQDLNHQ